MAANKWLLQFLADVTGLPVERPAYGETTVLGAAFLAGLGVGLYPTLQAIEAVWRLDFRSTPRASPEQRAARLAGWQDAVARVRADRTGR